MTQILVFICSALWLQAFSGPWSWGTLKMFSLLQYIKRTHL